MVKVWTNGCFDVLHRGHLEMLKYAKSLGDELVVGIDTDEKVRHDKGADRPFNSLEDRMELMRALRPVDRTVAFNSRQDLERLIEEYAPDYLVVGADWRDKIVVGAQYAKKVCFFDRIGSLSTTKILGYLK